MGRTWFQRIVMTGLLGMAAVVVGVIAAEQLGFDLSGVEALLDTVWARIPLSQQEVAYLGIAVTFGGIGLFTTTQRGLPALGRAYSLWRKDPVPIGDLHRHEGAVEVEGEAATNEAYGTIEAPYSGTDCLAFKYEEQEARRRGMDNEREWRVVKSGADSRPFTVTDETGTVEVDPTGATLSFDRDIVHSTNRTKETEWRLEPGETVYVSGVKQVGVADADPSGEERTYIGDGDDGSLTISDASVEWTILRFLAKGTIFSLMGTVFVVVGLFMLSALWG